MESTPVRRGKVPVGSLVSTTSPYPRNFDLSFLHPVGTVAMGILYTLLLFLALLKASPLAVAVTLIGALLTLLPSSSVVAVPFLLGMITPMGKLIGQPGLEAVSLLLALCGTFKGWLQGVKLFFPLLSLLGVWTIVVTFSEFDLVTLYSFQESWIAGKQWLELSPPRFIRVWGSFAHVMVLAGVYSFFSATKAGSSSFIFGACIGVVVSLAVVVLQLMALPLPKGFEQDWFWTAQGRFSGTFTDPNAFGVSLVLLVPLLLWQGVSEREGTRRVWRFYGFLALSAAVIGLGTFSGSRSFFLGMVFIALTAVFLYNLRAGLLVFLLSCFLTVLMTRLVFSRTEALAEFLPASLLRIISISDLNTLSESLSSRTLFWRVGASLWADYPWLGVGPERFGEFLARYSWKTGTDLGLWLDNANNYYLGVGAELGILGVAMVILVFLSAKWRGAENGSRLYVRKGTRVLLQAPVLSFLLLLWFGPHLNFYEVTILFGVLLALSVGVNKTSIGTALGSYLVPILGAVAVPLFLLSATSERGFYPWEKEGESHFRWTQRIAVDAYKCTSSEPALLKFQLVHPDAKTRPVSLLFTFLGGERQELLIDAGGSYSLLLPCAENRQEGLYKVEVSRPWIPALTGHGEDPRPLGIRIEGDPRID